MRRTVIKFSEFKALTAPDRAAAVRELARDAMRVPNGEMKLVDARIRSFEQRYEITSARMETLLAEGKLQETADVASWLIALDVQRRLRGHETRT